MIIDCKKIAESILQRLYQFSPPKKYFAAFIVGDNKASFKFLEQKKKVAQSLNIDFRIYKYPFSITNDFLRKEIHKIVGKKNCGGAIIQLPFPENLNPQYVLNTIPPQKDVDVLGERALGAFYTGRNKIIPPACGVTEEIIKFLNLNTFNLKVAIIGAGNLISKPISVWFLNNKEVKEIFILKKGSDLSLLKNADLIICGANNPNIINPSMIKENSTVIDFGYYIDENGKISGNFSVENDLIEKLNIKYTPTPSGTGPILVAKIFENFFTLNKDN